MNDLQDTPNHWCKIPLKRFSDIVNSGCYGEEKTSKIRPVPLRVITTANIDPLSGFKLNRAETRFFTTQEQKKYAGLPGDIFVVKSSGSNVNIITGKRAQVLEEPDLIFSNFLLRVRPREFASSRFVYYLLGSSFVHERIKREVATTTYPNLKVEKYVGEPLPFPPLEEQTAIANFLDRETARIDRLIEKKGRFIELLTEKCAAVITHAVTKGIDADMPMKDSGQDWIGSIPSDWSVLAAARLFIERDTRSKSGDEEMLTVSHLTGVTPRSQKTVNMIEAETTVGYKICYAGDLVVNTLWAWMGAMGTAPMLGIVSPAYNVYTPKNGHLDPAYVDYLVKHSLFAKEVTRFSKGVWSSRLRLYPEGLREIRMPVPPRSTQTRIVEHLNRETRKIEGLISTSRRSIELLKEKRSALITAAVTGKIDVRSVA
jgi:type I restriction enzyme S subunit